MKCCEKIARELGIAITTGTYLPGDVLPGEVASSRNLKVSRTAYREAVRTLAAKGLVEAKTKVGTKVCAAREWQMLDPDVLAWGFEGDSNLGLLQHLFELLCIVEPAAAALAAGRRTEAHLKSMQYAVDTLASHGFGSEEGGVANREFHATLLMATANPYFMSLIAGVTAAIATTARLMPVGRNASCTSAADHRRVLMAISEKDSEGTKREMSKLIIRAGQEALANGNSGPEKITLSAIRVGTSEPYESNMPCGRRQSGA